ncbi:hypothetical protein VE23_00865 [Paenibacillus sp. D9]|nr:hypothetical protein VE23_00865 [Paenibacillus sp. D9]
MEKGNQRPPRRPGPELPGLPPRRAEPELPEEPRVPLEEPRPAPEAPRLPWLPPEAPRPAPAAPRRLPRPVPESPLPSGLKPWPGNAGRPDAPADLP